jgi:hypothetical protein
MKAHAVTAVFVIGSFLVGILVGRPSPPPIHPDIPDLIGRMYLGGESVVVVDVSYSVANDREYIFNPSSAPTPLARVEYQVRSGGGIPTRHVVYFAWVGGRPRLWHGTPAKPWLWWPGPGEFGR